MTRIFVLNAGSSSLKYRVIELGTGEVRASGNVERIGVGGPGGSGPGGSGPTAASPGADGPAADGPAADGPAAASTGAASPGVPDHDAAMRQVLGELGNLSVDAVGHRIVHGGDRFTGPTLVDDAVEADIEALVPLAPLHNPAGLQGIRAARAAFPDVPHVAVFDTAFHSSLPAAARTYAIDRELAAAHGIRRYGFHGTSYQYVSAAAARFLGRPLDELRMVVLHLGNGASAAAIARGRSVDTSMGLTPLEGLVMGSRSGDLDPAILPYLHRVAGLDFDEVDDLLNRRSGLLGLSGHSDLRAVIEAAGHDGDARLALEVYIHRIRHYVGAYAALLGGIDALVFTAGVGENSSLIRAMTVEQLGFLGLSVDAERNRSGDGPRFISPEGSPAAVLVVPTDEEAEIARQTAEVAGLG